MKKKTIIISAILAFLPAVLHADTPQRIQRLLDSMPMNGQAIPVEGSFACPQLGGTLQFYTESESGGTSQLGARLFSDGIRSAYDPVIIRCVERLWVELLVRKTTDSQKALLKEYGVRMVLDGYPLGSGSHRNLSQDLEVINSITSLTMTTGTNEIDLFMRSRAGSTLHIYIPADRDLLFPYDKKEHEELLLAQLEHSTARYAQMEPGGLECYMIDSLTNEMFFSGDQPVFDRNFPAESMRNILMCALPASDFSKISLRIQPHTYSKELGRRFITVRMSDFLGYFQKQGLKFYSAKMENAGDRYQCILVMFHPTYNYLHMFSLSFTPDQLFSDKAVTLKSDLSTFIPQHNIKNLFQEK